MTRSTANIESGGESRGLDALGRKNFTNGGSFDPSDTDPLFGHRNEGLHSRFDRFKPLRQCGGLPIGGHDQKRPKSLEKHGHHGSLDTIRQIVECVHLTDDGIELRRSHKVRAPLAP